VKGRFGLVGLLFLVLFALLVGGIGYAIGTSTTATAVAVAPAPGVIYPVYAHWGFGLWFPFGILFFFLFIGLLFAAFRPRRWNNGNGGPGGPGWYGPRGGWGSDASAPVDPNDPRVQNWVSTSVPPAMQAAFESWHRQQHQGQAAGPATSAPGATPPPPAGPASQPPNGGSGSSTF